MRRQRARSERGASNEIMNNDQYALLEKSCRSTETASRQSQQYGELLRLEVEVRCREWRRDLRGSAGKFAGDDE